MSGHSKWKTTKNKKAAADAVKGRLFTKATKEITVAAKDGGGDPDMNPRLRIALAKAKEANMPKENVEKAIKKGTGELPGVSYEEMMLEGYGPGGVAIYIELLTDNKNRTSSEVRNIFSKKGGNMAGAGSVSWIFEKKGYIAVAKSTIEEDRLMSIVLDAGAEDMIIEDAEYGVKTLPQDFFKVKKALEDAKVKIESAELTMLPKNTVKLTGDDARKVLELIDSLEEHEDVQNVYANFDIPDEIISQQE